MLPVQPDEAFNAKARALRPFYFIVVVWGERYTDFLLNFCIPALLSPGNIPALHNRAKNKFLIATTDEDWARMQDRPIFRMLRDYVEAVFIRIPPCPDGVSGCVHMGIGHKLATQIAFEARAYSVLLTPDLMVSDGTMSQVQRHAVNGVQVVLTAALRFGEEPLFKHLDELGICNINSRFGDEARALIASGRQLVKAGIQSFHSETARYEWQAPYFSMFPVACWWRVPDEEGIVVHCLSWAPLLVDYAAVDQHDSSVMDHWTIDGDYVYRNFGMKGNVHVEQDSDNIMLVSWAPLADREQPLHPRRAQTIPLIGNYLKGAVLYETFNNAVFDPLKRNIFFLPVRWHARDITPVWSKVEKRASASLRRHLALSSATKVRIFNRVRAAFVKAVVMTVRLGWYADYYWHEKGRVLGIAGSALKGDPAARQRIKRAVRHVQSQLLGRPIPRG